MSSVEEIKRRQREILKVKMRKSGIASKPKKCTDCGEVKPRSEFAAHDTSSDGFASVCNACRNIRNNNRRETNPEHRLKHHIAVRVQKQLGLACPLNYQRDLENYLGYKISALRLKLEEDLKEENLELLEAFKLNYHLDHITPLHSFNVKHAESQAFKDCWRIDNLKLIPAEVNLAKSGKLISHEEAAQRASK